MGLRMGLAVSPSLHTCQDGPFLCPEGPYRKLNSTISHTCVQTGHLFGQASIEICCVSILAHFSRFLPPSQANSFSLLGSWEKTLDPSILKLTNSNPTPGTWSSKQDLRFHQLLWGKSENPSSSRFVLIFESLNLISQFSIGIECFGVFLIISKHWVAFWWEIKVKLKTLVFV
jgi:hypothetical protein